MAPPPEYDKEPKAPDKSATNISSDDTKALQNLVNDLQSISDNKPTSTVANNKVENNKHVETLDDVQLRALLDEAIAYKRPKDRVGKSSLFKELLEEVELDDQEVGEAAARSFSGGRTTHSNSLQNLFAAAALAAEPRRTRHHTPAPTPAPVSTRAIHGGSLPSGVDTSSLLCEEPAEYVATVRCFNPSPLSERSDTLHETDPLNRRTKPMYTARATLEIGSGSVCSGRAVTTTTASNQVRTPRPPCARHTPTPRQTSPDNKLNQTNNQRKLMSVFCPEHNEADGGGKATENNTKSHLGRSVCRYKPRGPKQKMDNNEKQMQKCIPTGRGLSYIENKSGVNSKLLSYNIDKWYKDLDSYCNPMCLPTTRRASCSSGEITNTRENKDDKCIRSLVPHSRINKGQTKPYTEFDNNRQRFVNVSASSNLERGDNLYRVNKNKHSDNNESDTRLRKKYHERIGKALIAPKSVEVNPENIRKMTIGNPQVKINEPDHNTTLKQCLTDEVVNDNDNAINNGVNLLSDKDISTEVVESGNECTKYINTKDDTTNCFIDKGKAIKSCDHTFDIIDKTITSTPLLTQENTKHEMELPNLSLQKSEKELVNFIPEKQLAENEKDIELVEIKSRNQHLDISRPDSFSSYLEEQNKLFHALEANSAHDSIDTILEVNSEVNNSNDFNKSLNTERLHETKLVIENDCEFVPEVKNEFTIDEENIEDGNIEEINNENNVILLKLNDTGDMNPRDQFFLTDLPENAYVFLTLSKRLLTPLCVDSNDIVRVHGIDNNNRVTNHNEEGSALVNTGSKSKKLPPTSSEISDKKKITFKKNALKILLFENSSKGEDKSILGLTSTKNEIDSAISFSCITTPEVVSSCNTTSSTSQAAVAVDPKPRSVISSSFNGLPLSRPNYGSTGTTAPEEYKKSLDENGNSVQGYSSSSVSGSSSQHKKPRRKKSSKNESVIESQNIDGYQGNKDLNEVLRFIESNADNGRAQKLGRAKHRDDVDDKGAKKRSTERRKDKENKIKRATSLEELSRTKLEDLTDKPEPTLRKNKKERWTDGESAAKAERRSWGDDAREFYNPDNTEAAAVELTDFQTVTKKRKPRRRTDETEKETVGDPTPRRNRVPSPRPRRESAPPSDRSNDSNDDMDSVHSLPAPAPTAHHASYADIARTRHNIPDLIESCNFYAENAITVTPTAPSAGDADGYPALERATPARRRDKPQGSTTRRERKERGDCPAPDVVADRPPVVLLDSSVKPRDMDGVTFGFDINEQLLSGSVRKPRCDLVRDTIAAGVSVRAGCGSVRYMPPTAPTDMHLLHQLVDYVGSAWEDIMRCGGGKVRYYTD